MTGLLPAALAAQLASVAQKRWWDPWAAQLHAVCDGCAEDDQVMLVDEGVHLCAVCHEVHLVIWRKEDEEDERRELLMDELIFRNGPCLDDAFNAAEDADCRCGQES